MKTPGEALVQGFPDEFDPGAADSIDQDLRARLIDPARRGSTLQKLRARLTNYDNVPDDAVMMDVIGRIDAKRQPQPLDPQEARESQEGLRQKKLAHGYGTSLKQAAKLRGGGEMDAPPETLEKSDAILRGQLTPADTANGARVQGRGEIPAMAERIEDLQEAVKKDPRLKIVQANTGRLSKFFPNVQLQDAGNNTISQLNPAASFQAEQVAGMPKANLGEITGAGSTFQQALTETARDVYDPKTGKWFRGMDPKTANLGKDGTGNPLSRAQGYGFREYGMDVGARQTDDTTSWKVANLLAAPAAAALSGVDKMEEGIFRAIDAARPWETVKSPGQEPSVWGRLAQENKEESQKYWNAAGQLVENTGWFGDKRNAVPDTPEATAEANRGLGATMGEALSMKVPTGGDKLVQAVAPVVAKGVGAGAREVSKAAERFAPELHSKVVGVFSSLPAGTALDKGSTNVFKGAQAAAKNAGDLAEVGFATEAREAVESALAGRTPQQIEAALEEAKRGWNSVAARRAMSPDAKVVVDTLQPFHERAFRSMFGDSFPYNPTHVFRGQRATKAAKVLETSRAQDAAADVALQQDEVIKDVGKTHMGPIQQGAVPGWDKIQGKAELREARGWEDTQKMLADQGREAGFIKGMDMRRGAELMEDTDAIQGMARTFRLGVESKGMRERAAARVFEDNLGALKAGAYKDSYVPAQQRFGMTVDQMMANTMTPPLKGMAGPAQAGPVLHELNAYRDAIKRGRAVLNKDVTSALAKNDEVIIRGLKASDDGGAFRQVVDPKQQRVVFIPGLSRDMDGMVMPRLHAEALLQAQSPSAAQRAVTRAATVLDQVLGLSQLNYAITRGNMGFEARNRFNEMMRMAADDEEILGSVNRRFVEKVLSSKPGVGPYGRIHQEVLSLGGLGKGLVEDLRGNTPNPGPVWLPEGAKKVLNAPARAADVAQDALVNAPIKRGLFPRVPKQYGVDDSFRAAVMLNEMRKGASAVDAAAHMKRLMIDYSDKNLLEQGLKPFIPFIKYYTGAAEGVAALAMKNPRRFARVYDLARLAERWDTEFEGGGRPLNQKLKTSGDWLGGRMLMQEGDSISTIRPETVASEVGSQIDLWASGLGGLTGEDPEQGLGANLGPAWSAMYDLARGESLATGRSTSGLSAKEMALARDEGAHTGPAQALKAYELRKAGIAPSTGADRLALARDLAKYLPVVSRIGDAPYLRYLTGLAVNQTNPASRSEESINAMARRGARAQLTGLRSDTVVPSQRALDQQRKRPQPKSRSETKQANQRTVRVP